MAQANTNGLVSEVHDGSDGYVRGNHWAIPYISNHSFLNNQKLDLLEHVNCTYLSTPGRPPTLLALKQHAQSLAVLISMINPSRESGEIDNANVKDGETTRAFTQHEAFDWLNNLLVHYDSLDKDHQRPLNSLVNLIRSNSDIEGVEYHCPLDTIPEQLVEENKEAQYRPFENHLTLLMHANDCLERLDHEYSALGGLLSIIPTDQHTANESEALKGAKETLVGQWILHTQHLVSRMHELEINYGNCLELLANEALIPAQHNSAHGPDGRSGREIVFPQDRWILANAGEDVFNFIHQMLDKKEAALDRVDDVHEEHGVVGGTLYEQDKTRGIVALELSTRFYRVKGSGHGPIFVLPAYGDRPSTEYLREMEGRPPVITLPVPDITQRTTSWDLKNRNMESTANQQSLQISNLQRNVSDLTARLNRQVAETRLQRATIKAYEEASSDKRNPAIPDEIRRHQTQTAVSDQIQRLQTEKMKAEDQVATLGTKVIQLEKQVAAYKKQVADMYKSIPGLAAANPVPRPAATASANPSADASMGNAGASKMSKMRNAIDRGQTFTMI